jgi:peptidyl-prolyl cis-trans isomerase C
MTKTRLAAAMLAALLPVTVLHAQAPAPKPAAPKPAAPAPAAPQGKTLYTQAQFDLLLRERMAQGQPDTPELRNAVREELNTRALLVTEAKKKNLDKKEEVKTQMDLASQTALVRAYVTDWVRANPVSEDAMRKEYEAIRKQLGDKEYKVAHILVEKEDEAKQVIADLQKGQKFDEIAKQRSKDPGSKDRGGDLDWNAPGNFVKPFSDAMVATEKGKFTAQPVQTPFGWHVIRVDDMREAKVPTFEEVKPQLQQRMQAQALDQYLRDLRAKNGV